MGQYYNATFKKQNDKKWSSVTSWKFGWIGSKLMEHSYVNNPFVVFVKDKIFNNPMQVVWAGDYADPEQGHRKLNLFQLATKERVSKKWCPANAFNNMRYLYNVTKNVFIDYSKIKKDKYGYRIDPLPLLTAEGNGRGGGDYFGKNQKKVGSWARDLICVTKDIPQGAKELVINFKENR